MEAGAKCPPSRAAWDPWVASAGLCVCWGGGSGGRGFWARETSQAQSQERRRLARESTRALQAAWVGGWEGRAGGAAWARQALRRPLVGTLGRTRQAERGRLVSQRTDRSSRELEKDPPGASLAHPCEHL